LPQVHPGSLIFLDAQEQFLQHPYFISEQVTVSLFYTVGVFKMLAKNNLKLGLKFNF